MTKEPEVRVQDTIIKIAEEQAKIQDIKEDAVKTKDQKHRDSLKVESRMSVYENELDSIISKYSLSPAKVRIMFKDNLN